MSVKIPGDEEEKGLHGKALEAKRRNERWEAPSPDHETMPMPRAGVLYGSPLMFFVTFLTTSPQRSVQRPCNVLCIVRHNVLATFYATPLQRSM